ncbi:hypothetical protein MARI151_10326 [Maribacter litoralis]|uniref:Uncharacterized protein n=1 Tax=Maribacter litoralis TaxID=2059726 RepID=A0A653MCU1_9FLAO|nr:hypothetical protein MARI151_10326 [Maribacter litoralis]
MTKNYSLGFSILYYSILEILTPLFIKNFYIKRLYLSVVSSSFYDFFGFGKSIIINQPINNQF